MKQLSMRTKLFLITACTVLIPLSTLSFFAYRVFCRSAYEAFCNDRIGTVKKAGFAVDEILNDIEQTSLLIITNDDLRRFLSEEPEVDLRWNAYSLLAYLKNSSSAIRSLHLMGNNEQVLTLGENAAAITLSDIEKADQNNGAAFWAKETTGFSQDIYLCRLIRNARHPAEHLGYMKIYVDLKKLSDRLFDNNRDTMDYCILSSDGSVFFTTDDPKNLTLPPVETLKTYQMDCRVDTKKGQSITVYPLSNNGMMLVGVSGTESLLQQNRANALLYAGISLSSFLFCLLLAQFLSRRALHPLTELVEHMKQIEEGNLDIRIDGSGDPEIETVSRQFNSMTAKIQSLIVEVCSVSIKRKEAELRALQTQIKPHFLYNTLDLAYWNAQAENAPMTAELINSLSQFFRYGLIRDSEFTILKNELEHLRYYLQLQMRHNPNFDYEQEVDEQLYNCKIVKLILQPLVENAFIHGINGLEDGKITVRIYRTGDTLHYEISDNGSGADAAVLNEMLSQDQTPASPNGHGVGLKNVHDRIQLAFGSEYGITVSNNPDGGAVFHVIQPYIPMNETADYKELQYGLFDALQQNGDADDKTYDCR